MSVQALSELETFWQNPDPWAYYTNPSDRLRLAEFKTALPAKKYSKALDVGCGNGFLTFNIPADWVIGTDVCFNAVEHARRKAEEKKVSEKFQFFQCSMFDLHLNSNLEDFDLIVVTGVLYPQYLAKGFAALEANLIRVLRPGGILLSCHIGEWNPPPFSLSRLSVTRYPYREYEHLLEVYQK
jgi:SAM-dependent methyltransferase